MILNFLRRVFGHTTSGAPDPLLATIHMPLEGLHEEIPASQDSMRIWRDPRGLVLSLASVSGAPVPEDHNNLRDWFRRMARDCGAGLIEADIVESCCGQSSQMIYKRLIGTGFMFTGMLLMPAGDRSIVWTASSQETGVTGLREAVVTADLMSRGELTLESYESSWAQDPYQPGYSGVDRRVLRYISDSESYDSQFPDHPLSLIRHTLRKLALATSLENVE